MEKIYLEIWQENPKTKQAFRVRQEIAAMSDCPRIQANNFFTNYLLESSGLGKIGSEITRHNLENKLSELTQISEIYNSRELEAIFHGARFFVRFSNFAPA